MTQPIIQKIHTDKGRQMRKVTVLKNGKRVTEMQPVGPNHTLALVDGRLDVVRRDKT